MKDRVVVIRNEKGDEERLRVLWPQGDMLRVKSLDNPHRKGFMIKAKRVIRDETAKA